MRRGALTRRYRGVYSIAPGQLSRDAELLAVVLAGGNGAALNRLAAAELWQAWRYRAPLSIIVPSRRRIRGVEVHRCTKLDPRDVTLHKGIPVTTLARTLVDLTDTHIAIEVERRPDLVLGALYPRLKALKAERLVPSSSIRPDSTCLLSGRESSS